MSVYEGHSDIIYPWQIDARIEDLQAHHDLPGANVCTTCDQDEHEELEVLTQFRQDVKDTCGDAAWDESGGFLAESYFDEYQYQQQKDIYGEDVVDTKYWDDDEWTDDQREQFVEIDFDGVTYLIDKEV